MPGRLAIWPGGPESRQVPIKRAGGGRIAAPLAKALDLEHPHRAVERQRDHVAGRTGMAGRGHALAVEPDMSRPSDQRRSVAARAHHARVPQPFIDALPIQLPIHGRSLAALLELLLERGELGERRIGIRRLVAVRAAAMRLGVILLAFGAIDRRLCRGAAGRRAAGRCLTLAALAKAFGLTLHALLTLVAVPYSDRRVCY